MFVLLLFGMEVLELEDQPKSFFKKALFLSRQRRMLEEFSKQFSCGLDFKRSADKSIGDVAFARTTLSPLTIIVGNEFYTVHLKSCMFRDKVLIRRGPRIDAVIVEYTDAERARRQCEILGVTLEELLDRIAFMKKQGIYSILIKKW
ncbi:MAG: hypothetical protein DRJ60_00300 [Thermoprotei archaeon]|nr:MAG: hypothetical protein DRJ60_00300 [Thermoprotei archaeon]